MSHSWWQTAAIYQIYPRSFQDSDGDGVGDLRGMTTRLQYLAELGIDAVWLSPIYPSPLADFGYDVADHCSIDPVYGTLADFDALVETAHGLGLRVILDYIPNHTSDQHPWFAESRRSTARHKRDWYIWRDPRPDGSEPTNWLSEFGGPAWTFDDTTGQYYYHAYLKQQPDLNWRNAEVREAMLRVLRYWLERGVDGFRVDAIHHLIESEKLVDNPVNPEWRPGMSPARRLLRVHTMDQPEVHEAIAAMRRLVDEYDDRLLIGEAYLPLERLMAYYGADLGGFHLPFNFQLISAPWQPTSIAALIEAYERALPKGAWPNWVLGNHDRSRVATRLGAAQARVAAMLLLTLRGTPTIYQGEEIGMTDVLIPPDAVQDPWERNVPGLELGRDPERTPMQWDAGKNAGFSGGQPWLPLSPEFGMVNVAEELREPRSMLWLYRKLLALRRATPALQVGTYREIAADESVLTFEREHEGTRCRVALNFSSAAQPLPPQDGVLLLSSNLDLTAGDTPPQQLRPHEGIVVQCAQLSTAQKPMRSASRQRVPRD
ncbi:MAG: alpha-amylase family glycosyl hydrolase [Xanthobacteraceae bacterium]